MEERVFVAGVHEHQVGVVGATVAEMAILDLNRHNFRIISAICPRHWSQVPGFGTGTRPPPMGS